LSAQEKNRPQDSGDVKLDLEKLQGTWVRPAAKGADGKEAPAIKLVLAKDHLSVTNETELKGFDFDIELRAEGKKRLIALTPNNKAVRFSGAAYNVQGDKLTLESGNLAGWDLKGEYKRGKKGP
jgi:hypothetical protein